MTAIPTRQAVAASLCLLVVLVVASIGGRAQAVKPATQTTQQSAFRPALAINGLCNLTGSLNRLTVVRNRPLNPATFTFSASQSLRPSDRSAHRPRTPSVRCCTVTAFPNSSLTPAHATGTTRTCTPVSLVGSPATTRRA